MSVRSKTVPLPSGREGFTLLEMVVSLSILAAIAAFLVLAFRLTGNSMERGGTEAMKMARLRAGIEILERAIRSSDPMPLVAGQQPVPFFRGGPEMLIFLSAAAPSAASGGGFRLLRFSGAEPSAVTPGLLLAESSPFRAEGADMWEGTGTERVVIAGASEVSFRYSPGPTAEGKWEWVEDWDAGEKKSLPAAVRVGFMVPSATGQERTEFVVPVPAGGV